jgi:hypothetical protein
MVRSLLLLTDAMANEIDSVVESRFSMCGKSFLCCVLFASTIMGCGPSGPPLASVEGRITVDGKPVPSAVLTFAPEGGSPSYGYTDKDGKYVLRYTDEKVGAMLGNHRVEIRVSSYSKSEREELKASGAVVPEESIQVPKKYLVPGALTAVVKEGRNTIDFALDHDRK